MEKKHLSDSFDIKSDRIEEIRNLEETILKNQISTIENTIIDALEKKGYYFNDKQSLIQFTKRSLTKVYDMQNNREYFLLYQGTAREDFLCEILL